MRLIDADALTKKAVECNNKHEFGESVVCISDINDAPTIDPVKHGRWVEAMQREMHLYPDGQKMCNVCHTIMPSTWNTMPPFCFGCGADMRGAE